MKFVGPMNITLDPLVLLKCALYTKEKSTKKKKKLLNLNPNYTLMLSVDDFFFRKRIEVFFFFLIQDRNSTLT